MNDDFSKYHQQRRDGATAEQVFRVGAQGGLDLITRIRMIRAVYGLSPMQAKEVMLRAEEIAGSLEEHQQRIANTLPEPIS